MLIGDPSPIKNVLRIMKNRIRFLFVIISTLQLMSTGAGPVVHNVQGIVGGSVKMHCELEHPHIVSRVYFQKTEDGMEVFINGFYSRGPLTVPEEYKDRTIVDQTELSMEMYKLSPADEGEYTCIIFFSSDSLIKKTKFHLTVTANYSVSVITIWGCGSDPADYNCVIGCSASGGYPRSSVTWGVVGADMSNLLMRKRVPVFTQDRDSLLWNVSHVVMLNCRWMVNTWITCSVGGVVSHGVSVCAGPVVRYVKGIVGGSVKMHCELQHPHIVNRLYFLKTVDGKEVFINGFYSRGPLTVPEEYKDRTIVNQTELSMEMYELSPADEGEYTCITFFSSDSLIKKNKFHLTVTVTAS
ncbi:T-lymphocyte activation antigen CD80 [Ictalurus furcatus]|uniref:T-lymphocyte activation antigen CD80 n=1 Tax=Ictalurus furcatus TaxID=66913 RepID=UPI00234FD823|nr:T-lymphocyte activation antigen CD80 [Ictalurus furcatus]XP_053503736.1 T-lymphocyte activation antigen CD80 [Ictalurus furcatus]